MSDTPIGDEVMARMTNLVKSTENIARIKLKIEISKVIIALIDDAKTKAEVTALRRAYDLIEKL